MAHFKFLCRNCFNKLQAAGAFQNDDTQYFSWQDARWCQKCQVMYQRAALVVRHGTVILPNVVD